MRSIESITEYVKKNYGSMGPLLIMKELGWNRSKMYRYTKSIGLSMTHEQRSQLRIRVCEKLPEEFKVNHLQFSDVNKPEAAYLLGFLWADGCIYAGSSHISHTIRCGIASDDADDLCNVFSSTGKWNIHRHKVNSSHPTWKRITTFHTNNKHLYKILNSMDYGNKNGISPTKVIQSIPFQYQFYWWRGFFDGDGCLWSNGKRQQMTLAGPYDQDWSFVIDLFQHINIQKYSIRRTISKKGHRSSSIKICSKKSIRLFMEYIYPPNDFNFIGLNRKYKKYKTTNLLYKKIISLYE